MVPTEFVLWIFVAAFGYGELEQMRGEGLEAYFESTWNKLDVVIYFLFFLAFLFRMLVPFQFYAVGIVISCCCVLLWLRLTYIFIVHPMLGPVLSMMERMVNDILTFLCILVLFLFGFAWAFFFLLNGRSDFRDGTWSAPKSVEEAEALAKSDKFSSVSGSIIYLLQSLLGQYDYSWFEEFFETDPVVSWTARLFYSMYLALGIIILFNLFIAMISKRYAKVQSMSVLEFVFGKSELIWNLSQSEHQLPPPLNILVTFCFVLTLIVQKLRNLCCKNSERKGNSETKKQVKKKKLAATPAPKQRFLMQEELQPYPLKSLGSRASLSDEESSYQDRSALALEEEFSGRKWHCSHCWFLNSDLSAEDRQRLQHEWGIARGIKSSDLNLINIDAQFCKSCMMIKNKVGRKQLLVEHVAAGVFIVTLWLPMVLLLALPCAAHWISTAVKGLSSKKKKEKAKMLRSTVNKKLDSDKMFWIRKSLVKDTHTINDLYFKLNAEWQKLHKEDDSSSESESEDEETKQEQARIRRRSVVQARTLSTMMNLQIRQNKAEFKRLEQGFKNNTLTLEEKHMYAKVKYLMETSAVLVLQAAFRNFLQRREKEKAREVVLTASAKIIQRNFRRWLLTRRQRKSSRDGKRPSLSAVAASPALPPVPTQAQAAVPFVSLGQVSTPPTNFAQVAEPVEPDYADAHMVQAATAAASQATAEAVRISRTVAGAIADLDTLRDQCRALELKIIEVATDDEATDDNSSAYFTSPAPSHHHHHQQQQQQQQQQQWSPSVEDSFITSSEEPFCFVVSYD